MGLLVWRKWFDHLFNNYLLISWWALCSWCWGYTNEEVLTQSCAHLAYNRIISMINRSVNQHSHSWMHSYEWKLKYMPWSNLEEQEEFPWRSKTWESTGVNQAKMVMWGSLTGRGNSMGTGPRREGPWQVPESDRRPYACSSESEWKRWGQRDGQGSDQVLWLGFYPKALRSLWRCSAEGGEVGVGGSWWHNQTGVLNFSFCISAS